MLDYERQREEKDKAYILTVPFRVVIKIGYGQQTEQYGYVVKLVVLPGNTNRYGIEEEQQCDFHRIPARYKHCNSQIGQGQH